MTGPNTTENWRRVPSIAKLEADELVASRRYLERYLSERFREAFGAEVEEATIEMFPDGLLVTLLADVRQDAKYNVWAHTISRAFAEAGAAVPVNVVVRASEELRT